MTRADATSHYLVEWYWPASTVSEFDAVVTDLVDLAGTDAAVRVVATVLAESDEVAFAIFDARSAESVRDLCGRAGVPAQRLTPVVTRMRDAYPSSTSTGA